MSESNNGNRHKPELVRSGLLALWAIGTLVLFFCVVLLVYQMIRHGQSPLALSELPDSLKNASADSLPAAARSQEATLYFADATGLSVGAEQRRLEFTASTVQNCRHALDALIQGPQSPRLRPVVPPTTTVRGIYLIEGGELVIDLSRQLETGLTKSAGNELLVMQTIVATLTQPRLRGEKDAAVRSVRFLIEGAPPQETFPAHLDLGQPLRFDDSWTGGSGHGDA